MACHAGIICLIVAFAADPVLGAKSVVRMVQRQKNVAAGTEKFDQTHTVVRRMNNKTKNALTTETDTAADQLVSVGPNGALSGLRRHRDAVHGNLQLEEDATGKYVTVADVTFERSSGRDCTSADNVSVIRIDAITVTSVSQCLSACTSAQGCTCARYNRMFLECHLLSNCALPTFCARSSRFDMYVDTATDAPTESPTEAPTPYPTQAPQPPPLRADMTAGEFGGWEVHSYHDVFYAKSSGNCRHYDEPIPEHRRGDPSQQSAYYAYYRIGWNDDQCIDGSEGLAVLILKATQDKFGKEFARGAEVLTHVPCRVNLMVDYGLANLMNKTVTAGGKTWTFTSRYAGNCAVPCSTGGPANAVYQWFPTLAENRARCLSIDAF